MCINGITAFEENIRLGVRNSTGVLCLCLVQYGRTPRHLVSCYPLHIRGCLPPQPPVSLSPVSHCLRCLFVTAALPVDSHVRTHGNRLEHEHCLYETHI